MAHSTIAKTAEVAPHPILSLPFVADLPDPEHPRRTVRVLWNIPDEADYGDACDIGMRWGAAFMAYVRLGHDCLLPYMSRVIADREKLLPPNSGSIGFRVGFFSAIESLALIGSNVVGADKWLLATESFYRGLREKREVDRREQIAVRVSRMNAAKRAKKAAASHG